MRESGGSCSPLLLWHVEAWYNGVSTLERVMDVDMSIVHFAREANAAPRTFAMGEYSMDVEVDVGLRLSDTKAGPETEEDTLQMLLKTPRQKELYAEIKRRCGQG